MTGQKLTRRELRGLARMVGMLGAPRQTRQIQLLLAALNQLLARSKK